MESGRAVSPGSASVSTRPPTSTRSATAVSCLRFCAGRAPALPASTSADRRKWAFVVFTHRPQNGEPVAERHDSASVPRRFPCASSSTMLSFCRSFSESVR